MSKSSFRNFRHYVRHAGQGMTEFIIIVAAIGIGAIFVYTQFGDVLRKQTAASALALAGKNGSAQTAAAQDSANAASRGTSRNMGDFARAGNWTSGGDGGPGEWDGSPGGDGGPGGGDGSSGGDGGSGEGDGSPGGDGTGRFEPPPQGGKIPYATQDDNGVIGASGTSPLKTDGVMATICLSDTLCRDVQKWADRGVVFEYTTGGTQVAERIETTTTCRGSIKMGTETCTEEKKITTVVAINNVSNVLGVVQQIAHEVGHFESTVAKPRAEDVSKDVFVQSRLEDEGVAAIYNIKVRREMLATDEGKGPDIGVNCGVHSQEACNMRYEFIYNDYIAGKISENTARKKIADLRADEFTMKGPTYRVYYENEWYKKNPSSRSSPSFP